MDVHDLTEDEIVCLIRQIQDEHSEMRDLLKQVASSLIDRTADGITIVYLERKLLAQIQRVVAS